MRMGDGIIINNYYGSFPHSLRLAPISSPKLLQTLMEDHSLINYYGRSFITFMDHSLIPYHPDSRLSMTFPGPSCSSWLTFPVSALSTASLSDVTTSRILGETPGSFQVKMLPTNPMILAKQIYFATTKQMAWINYHNTTVLK